MCIVCTSRVTYQGEDRLDTTVKSADTEHEKLFAPTWNMVMRYKRKELGELGYRTEYFELIRSRYKENKALFLELLQRERVVVLCYCRPGAFCHRKLVVDILEKIAIAHGLPFERGGEI